MSTQIIDKRLTDSLRILVTAGTTNLVANLEILGADAARPTAKRLVKISLEEARFLMEMLGTDASSAVIIPNAA